MLIIVLDDEPMMLRAARAAVQKASPEAEVLDYLNPLSALQEMETRGLKPDFVFTDIEMPDMNGLQFAVACKRLSPGTHVVFVTAYAQYALDAFKIHAQGYILKPLEAGAVREELQQLPQAPREQTEKLYARCFGHFEIYYHEEPVVFQRKQSKELLAYLIDREGALCTAEGIASNLWENEDVHTAKARIRLLLHDLRTTLRAIGMEDALIRERRQIAVRRDLIECDYWKLLSGDADAVNSYRGEYMIDYSWAEITQGELYFRR